MPETPEMHGPVVPPASGRAPRSMVILLHGYGSSGEDLIGLVPYWRSALPDTVFLSPNAPQPCPGAPGGFQWWPLTSLSPQARATGVREAAPALNSYIDHQLAQHGLAEDELALVGFSQGTMAALHIGPRRERQLAGIVGYSGMLADPGSPASDLLTRPPVLLVHGDVDPMIPLSALHQTKASLESAGFDVTAHISPGLGHSIDQTGLQLGERFLRQVL